MKKRGKLLWLQLAVVAVIVGGVGWGLMSITQTAPTIPHQLGEDLHVVSSVTGDEAVKQMNQLHGLNLGVIGGYIATYQLDRQSSRAQATLWVGESNSPSGAARLLERMTGLMLANPIVFSPPQQRLVDGVIVYETQGQGGQHYFFQVNNKVVWLEVRGIPGEELLRDSLRKTR